MPDAPAHDEESRLLALTYAGGSDGGWRSRDGCLKGSGKVLSAGKRGLCSAHGPKIGPRRWRPRVVSGSTKRNGIEKLPVWRI